MGKRPNPPACAKPAKNLLPAVTTRQKLLLGAAIVLLAAWVAFLVTMAVRF